MKFLKLFENFSTFKGLSGELTLYHGSDEKLDLSKSKKLFLATDKIFAIYGVNGEEDGTAGRYGKYIYTVKVRFNNTFSSLDEEHMETLFNDWGISLYAEHYSGYSDDFDGEYNSYDDWLENVDEEDTWEPIEFGLKQIVKISKCDSVCITEGGFVNYIAINPKAVSLEIVGVEDISEMIIW
jgi:hypothetical protein